MYIGVRTGASEVASWKEEAETAVRRKARGRKGLGPWLVVCPTPSRDLQGVVRNPSELEAGGEAALDQSIADTGVKPLPEGRVRGADTGVKPSP